VGSVEWAGRRPDFVIIGTMKSGTTTLFEWLAARDDVLRPGQKEPSFFSDDRAWARGCQWYAGRFAGGAAGQLVGEASVSYTDPLFAVRSAERAKRVLCDPRLVCVLRDPIARLRSHYRHEVQRGRERRPFLEVIKDPAAPYIRRSRYAAGLAPWVQHFGSEALCVVRFEDLTSADETAWRRILAHLDLATTARMDAAQNVTGAKGQFSRPMQLLWKLGWTRAPAFVPSRLRRLAKRALIRESTGYRRALADSAEPLPQDVVAKLREDAERLPQLIGDSRLSWSW
jgi:hypothetical protein